MFGTILSLDAGRQQRVGTDVLSKLLKPETYEALKARRNALNCSAKAPLPFAPTLVRPAMYPEFFRVTELRTLFWKIKNMEGFHDLHSVSFKDAEHIVFNFSDSISGRKDDLARALKACGHIELVEPKVSGKNVTFTVLNEGSYTEPEGEEEK